MEPEIPYIYFAKLNLIFSDEMSVWVLDFTTQIMSILKTTTAIYRRYGSYRYFCVRVFG